MVFPNPADETVWFNSNAVYGDKVELQIFNTIGQQVLCKNWTGPNKDVDISLLLKGVYFWTVRVQGKLPVSGKFIKN